MASYDFSIHDDKSSQSSSESLSKNMNKFSEIKDYIQDIKGFISANVSTDNSFSYDNLSSHFLNSKLNSSFSTQPSSNPEDSDFEIDNPDDHRRLIHHLIDKINNLKIILLEEKNKMFNLQTKFEKKFETINILLMNYVMFTMICMTLTVV